MLLLAWRDGVYPCSPLETREFYTPWLTSQGAVDGRLVSLRKSATACPPAARRPNDYPRRMNRATLASASGNAPVHLNDRY